MNWSSQHYSGNHPDNNLLHSGYQQSFTPRQSNLQQLTSQIFIIFLFISYQQPIPNYQDQNLYKSQQPKQILLMPQFNSSYQQLMMLLPQPEMSYHQKSTLMHSLKLDQPEIDSIKKNTYNSSSFVPDNLFYMNSFYSRKASSNKKINPTSPTVNRPNYFGQNKTDDDEILDYIRDLITFDTQLEKLKLELLSYSDFSISDAFQLFDNNKTGQISLKQMKDGLGKIDIYPDNQDLFLLVHRFSRDGNNNLNFDEFTLLFIPFTGQPTKSQIKKTNHLGQQNYLQMSNLTKKALTNLMKQHLNIEFSLEQIRQNITRKQVNVQQVYQKIDQNGSGVVTADEFINYLKKKQVRIDKALIQSIMFRFDRNFSGKINREEFLYEFKTKIKKNL